MAATPVNPTVWQVARQAFETGYVLCHVYARTFTTLVSLDRTGRDLISSDKPSRQQKGAKEEVGGS